MKAKIKIMNICLFVLSMVELSLAQSNDSIKLPIPVNGWKSLQDKISYPEIARRAVLWGSYDAKLKIDSTGKMVDCKIKLANYEFHNCKDKMNEDDSLFIKYLQYVFKDLIWYPGKIKSISKTMEITIPLVFYFKERRETAPTLFIESNPQYPLIN